MNEKSLSYKFCNCKDTIIDVSGLDITSVSDMRYMFCNCSNIEVLDLSSWDLSDITSLGYMFYGCDKLKEVYCKSPTDQIKMKMSLGCSSKIKFIIK